jgi:hypothetical protein
MEVLKLTTTIDKSGYLNLKISTHLAAGAVDIVVVVNPGSSANEGSPKYDFSDLMGRLSLLGDPVEMQRSLRDEWE